MLHNFGHSFCSGMNWNSKTTELQINELTQLVEKGRYPFVKINFSSGILDPGIFSDEIMASIKKYREWLPEHAEAHGIDLNCVFNISFEVKLNNGKATCLVSAEDNRGKMYAITL